MVLFIKLVMSKLATMLVVTLMVGACFWPIDCDPSHDPELDKPLFDEPRGRDMDPSTAKVILPVYRSDMVRPSEVWKD